MRTTSRYLTAVLAAGCIAVLASPVSSAAPHCTNIGPNTTQCETRGSTQIVTSPPAMNYGPWFGWGIGGFVVGFSL
ncbi:hypothetical protein M2272_005975 [Mycobacterium frederiksbergense]|uniref:Uncharacterized protein n=1 Tax=Mycolicibacterium frederiksbergense TaxID=117567 RepID=A0ABT6L8R7_9MYCO|nr:hypothetical protein [Mycolicibacterium frederiksbergense]